MSDLTYFDCNVIVGQRPMKHRRERWSTEHLLEDMDLAEIAGALTVHAVATTYDPMYGNGRLHAEVAKAPERLFPAWCIAPLGGPGAYRTGDDLLRAMDEQGVRAVRIPPTGLSAHSEFLGPTLDALQERGVLTLMEAGSDRHPSGWGAADPFAFFHGLLSRHPRLPLLLIDHYWVQQAQIHRLMELHDNLHIEFSSYQINRGLERYVADFGDERLLFGSGMTVKSPGAARSFVDYAQIPQESKRRIAGGNLRRLLRGIGPKQPETLRRPYDPILADARDGRPLTTPVLDAHSHVLHEGGETAGLRYVMYHGGADGILEAGTWCGIDRVAMMSWNGPVCTDARDGNGIVWRAIRSHGRSVIGVAVIDPTHMSPEDIEEEIRLRYVEQGFVGMKPYPNMNLSYEDEAFVPWWSFGDLNRLYALVHVADQTGGLPAIERLADRFQDVSWVVAHAGAGWAFAEEVAACVRRHPNVYAEITYTSVTNGVIEFLVEAAGEDRVVFGSDQPMRDPRPQLGWVVWADLPAEVRAKVLGGNFQSILDRVRRSRSPGQA